MAELGPGRKPIVMPHYPHMLAEDNRVWTTFLQTDEHRLREVWYDVRVGQPVFLTLPTSEMEKRIADGLTRKRIDVVASVEDSIWVIEVKPRANMYALGQVLSYVRLFELEYQSSGRIVPVIVCDEIDQDLIDEFDEFGVLVIETFE